MADIHDMRDWFWRQRRVAAHQVRILESGITGVWMNDAVVSAATIADLKRVIELFDGIIAREQAKVGGETDA